MNMVLRILVILTLVLNGVALWFATSLYGKRNLLIDRNLRFKDFAVEIVKAFEMPTEEGEATEAAGDRVSRDVSDVSLATADIAPDYSDFWESYNQGLETLTSKTYRIPNEADLDEVYILDAENKATLDPTGKPITKGSPMDTELRKIVDIATKQLLKLNSVREQLTKLREAYEDAVTELNTVKKDARQSLKTIQEKEETISTLESEKAQLESEVTGLKDQISTLESEKQSLQADLDKANEEIETHLAKIDQLNKTMEKLIQSGDRGATGTGAAVANILAGVKGTVARVDNTYNFCIITLTDEAYVELVGEEGERELPEVEYFVRHPGNEDTVIGKIRLKTLTKDVKSVVCEILSDWKQGEVNVGDEIFYLD